MDTEASLLNFRNGRKAFWKNGSEARFENGSNLILDLGGTISIDGEYRVRSGGVLSIKSGGKLLGESGATIEGTFTYASNPTLAGNYTRTGKETRSGTGARTRNRVHRLTDTATDTISLSEGDIFLVPVNLANSPVYTVLDDDSPEDGEVIRVSRNNFPNSPTGVGSARIRREDATDLFVFPAGGASLQGNAWCDLMWNGTTAQWEVHGFGPTPTF